MLLPLKEDNFYRLPLIDNKGNTLVCEFKPEKKSILGALLTAHVHDILLLSQQTQVRLSPHLVKVTIQYIFFNSITHFPYSGEKASCSVSLSHVNWDNHCKINCVNDILVSK